MSYDGKAWRIRESRHKFRNSGLEVGDSLFFSTDEGVHVLTNGVWTYQRMKDWSVSGRVALRRSGGSVWAEAGAFAKPISTLWRWRGEAWQQLALPGKLMPLAAVPLDEKRLYLLFEKDKARVWQSESDYEARFSGLVDDLQGASSRPHRETIIAEIAREAVGFRPLIEDAISNTLDPDLIDTLVTAWEQMSTHTETTRLWFHDPARGISVFQELQNHKPAFVTVIGTGVPRRYAWAEWGRLSHGPLWAGGLRYWIATQDKNTMLFDFADGRELDRLPLPGYSRLLGRCRDGTLFAAQGRVSIFEPIIAYRPQFAKDFAIATGQELPVDNRSHRAMDSAGRLWASVSSDLSVFDGEKWQKVNGALPGTLIAGKHERIIAANAKQIWHGTLQAGKTYGSMRELIEQEKADLAANFRQCSGYGVPRIVAGGRGEIWLWENNELSVYDKGSWRTVGMPPRAGSLAFFAPFAAPGKLLVACNSAFFQAELLPPDSGVIRHYRQEQLPNGRVTSNANGGLTVSDYRGSYTVSVAGQLTESPHPRAILGRDAAGYLWQTAGPWSTGVAEIVRDDKVLYAFDANVDGDSTLCSPHEGLVFIWNSPYLSVFEAVDGPRYALRNWIGIPETDNRAMISPLG
ncbi:MAG: hypothetical protein ACI8W8_000910 [Rhodothermales bacterium]